LNTAGPPRHRGITAEAEASTELGRFGREGFPYRPERPGDAGLHGTQMTDLDPHRLQIIVGEMGAPALALQP
jgi:hypothetical protein